MGGERSGVHKVSECPTGWVTVMTTASYAIASKPKSIEK